MARVVKVFVNGPQQDELASDLDARGVHVRQQYGAFLLVEATDAVVNELADRFLVSDVTERYLDDPGGPERLPAGPHHHLVHFDGPIEEQWLTDVVDAGGTLRAPYDDFIFVVRADEAAVERIAALDHVRWVRHLPYEDRISAAALERAEALAAPTDAAPPAAQPLDRVFNVAFFGPEDAKQARQRVGELGFEVLETVPREDAVGEPGPWRGILVVRADPEPGDLGARLRELAAARGVQQIWPAFPARTSNDVAVRYMGTERATAPLGQGGLDLDGAGERVAICDSGLDTGHPDFAERVVAVKSYAVPPAAAGSFGLQAGADDGAADTVTGHGTHVAGSVLGDGSASNGPDGIGPIRGLAYRATLVFQAVEQVAASTPNGAPPGSAEALDPGDLLGIPVNFYWDILLNAYDQGARVHVNAWNDGGPAAVYTSRCEQIDQFVWDHKEFCVVVAAGNGGREGTQGRIRSESVLPPGTAKNCITVGASESLRPECPQTYGQVYPTWFPRQPFAGQPMADDPDQIAAFSGRGPTFPAYGWRLKPDVVAPGTFILSTRSSELREAVPFPYPGNDRYCYMSGTSQAAALVGGAVTLLRQYLGAYLRDRGSDLEPTAALVKAALVAGARRLPSEGGGAVVVDYHQGYGRVDLDAVLSPQAPARTEFLDNRQGLRVGDPSYSLPVVVRSADVSLRVVMAYSDYPSASPPPLRLVNCLNLTVTRPGPNQRIYAGNEQPGRVGPDTANNVEAVHIVDPPPGVWVVEVHPSEVPQGPQDFALVLCGDIDPLT